MTHTAVTYNEESSLQVAMCTSKSCEVNYRELLISKYFLRKQVYAYVFRITSSAVKMQPLTLGVKVMQPVIIIIIFIKGRELD